MQGRKAMFSREAQRNKVYSYGWCCLKAFCVKVKARELWQQLALHTLLHPAAVLHKKLPLVSFLALGPPLKSALIHEASIEVRSCTVHADSGFQLLCFEESICFAELIILDREYIILDRKVHRTKSLSFLDCRFGHDSCHCNRFLHVQMIGIHCDWHLPWVCA